jgi:hypothetical protein
MKKIRMGLMAMAAITGVGSALAFNAPKKVFGATYYAYIDGSGTQRWSSSVPVGSCGASSSVACTITSTTAPATVLATTNGFPANHTVQGGNGRAYSAQ